MEARALSICRAMDAVQRWRLLASRQWQQAPAQLWQAELLEAYANSPGPDRDCIHGEHLAWLLSTCAQPGYLQCRAAAAEDHFTSLV